MSEPAPLIGRLRCALVLVAGLFATIPAPAGVAGTLEDCGAIADRMERSEDIPPGLLHAVALAESGRRHPTRGDSLAWPWTIRSGPDSFYLDSKEMALRKVRELRAAGRSNIDVGCMQINLGYHGTAFASLDDAFDPTTNVAYGARFLKRLRQETRSWATAAGRYHSGDPERSLAYRARVHRLWRDLRRRQGGEAPMITEALFVGDGLARLAGGAVSVRSSVAAERSPGARIITPGSGSRQAPTVAVLRGR